MTNVTKHHDIYQMCGFLPVCIIKEREWHPSGTVSGQMQRNCSYMQFSDKRGDGKMNGRKMKRKWKRWTAGWLAALVLLNALAAGEFCVHAEEPEMTQTAETKPSEEYEDAEAESGDELPTLPEEEALPGTSGEQLDKGVPPAEDSVVPDTLPENPEKELPEGSKEGPEEELPEGPKENPEEEVQELPEEISAVRSANEDRIVLERTEGDHHMIFSQEPVKGFVYETEYTLLEGGISAALTFGIRDRENAAAKWMGANVNFDDRNARVFQVENGARDIGAGSVEGILDHGKAIHARLQVTEDGAMTYEVYNVDSPDKKVTVTGQIDNYEGGYLGLLTFNSKAEFTGTHYSLQGDEGGEEPPLESYHTNLEGLQFTGGEWKVTENGLYSDGTGKGDCFALSGTKGSNFVYSTEVTFESREGAAALVFRSNGDLERKECYAVNIDAGSHWCKFWRWQSNEALQLIDEKEVPATEHETYVLKVVAADGWILYYVNDQLVASTGDYTLQPGDLGQSTVRKEGVFGLLNWNSRVTFQNTYYKELDGTFNPLLKDLYVTASSGTVEKRPQFVSTEPMTIQYVRNDVTAVEVHADCFSEAAEVTVTDAKGTTYSPGDRIPVDTGINLLTITSKVCAEEDEHTFDSAVCYRVNVHRLKPDAVYYNEPYRGQYHYSVKEGWANDPNGMVYYKGKYHLFYQFYDDRAWGPMHWAHAVSTDLLHWEDQPIALYPDANGAMFSGCIVVDEHNTSGLFSGEDGGLVALITADGNGQRIKLAYSEDEGASWTKVDEIAADWTDDPLQNRDFRDPKVFRWENKWFMVVAGGPLRIYSSEDLRSWNCESVYADLHTECPDLYPVETEAGQVKWVLSRGGRFYKIGDFRQQDGKWQFFPDSGYESRDGIMNFGHDSYAAMTYYVQDFGTAEHPSIPKIIELNWMNTWNDYCNQVAVKNGSDFNGTFNLQLTLGLAEEDGTYVLTQTPLREYETLRDTEQKIEYKRAAVKEDNKLLEGFAGDAYEIVSRFYPGEGTRKVGFRLRTGEGEETQVIYDLEKEWLSIDRSRSGILISGEFAKVDGQQVTPNADGSVDLHIYVDRSSVEVFAKGNTAAGAEQIFPSPSSVGASVLIEGEGAEADIEIYPFRSIWKDRVEVTAPQMIGSTMALEQRLYAGREQKLKAYVLPISVDQEIVWSVVSGDDVVSVDRNGTVTGKKAGTAVVKAASKADPSLTLEFTLEVKEDRFQTNIPEYVSTGGNWFIDGETLMDFNTAANDFYLSAEPVEGDCSMEADISFERGLVNLFAGSASGGPFAEGGAYALQLSDRSQVRLFRFGVDGDTALGSLPEPVNDGAYHHIQVTKTGNLLQVYMDRAEEPCLSWEFDQTEEFFQNGHMGIGLWDGAVNVQNLYVYIDLASVEEAVEQAGDVEEEIYTAESYQAYKEALRKAQQLLKDGTSSKKEADTVVRELKEAKDALTEKEKDPGSSGDDSQKPGGEDTGEKDPEQKPGGDDSGNKDPEQKPGGDDSGEKDQNQKPGSSSGGKKKGSSGRGSGDASVPPASVPAAAGSEASVLTASSGAAAGNFMPVDEAEEAVPEETGSFDEQITKNEEAEPDETPEEIVDLENGEIPLAAGTGKESRTGSYAVLLTVLALALSAGGIWLVLTAKRQKEENE